MSIVEVSALVVKIRAFVKEGQLVDAAITSYLSGEKEFLRVRDEIEIELFGDIWDAIRANTASVRQLEEQERIRKRFYEDREGMGIVAGYLHEGVTEPLDERRRMWAYATGGLANLDLSIAEHARVQRILRELDSEDIVTLYKLSILPHSLGRCAHERFQVSTPGQASEVIALKFWEQSARESLATSGCVRIVAAGGGAGVGTHEELRLTNTGRLVLKVLRPYVRVLEPDVTDVPGHESDGCRPKGEALELIDSVPRLREILLEAVAGRKGYVSYDGCHVADGVPANGRAVLRLHLKNAEDGEHLESVTTREDVQAHKPVHGIYVDHIDHRPEQEVEHYLHLAGPHDVLRWLAYDVDAFWV